MTLCYYFRSSPHAAAREALQDSKLTLQGKALLNNWKLEQAGNLLKQSAISMAQYHAIQPGMSYQQVVTILGGRPGVEAGRGENIVTYQWQNPDGSMLVANFINGRMTVKVPAGLR